MKNRMTNRFTFPDHDALLRDFIRSRDSSRASDAEFNRLALPLFQLQFASVPVYRAFCEGRGISAGSVTDWRNIPALPIVAFKETEVSSLATGERSTVFHSSGTTGQTRSRHFHSAESLRLYEMSALPPFRHHVLGEPLPPAPTRPPPCPEKMEFLFLVPPPALAPHSSLVHMFELIRRELAPDCPAFAGQLDESGGWTLHIDAATEVVARSTRGNRPLALLGTAFSFVHLLDHLAARDIRHSLPVGSRVMETGGYKGRSRPMPKRELHGLIRHFLGVPDSHIVCEYGMSELSSQAYDRVAGTPTGDSGGERTFNFPPWARVEVVSPETGRSVGEGGTGLLRVFDLANARSVLAIQTEDLAVRRGDGFEWIGRAAMAEPRGCSLMAT
jgi:hypothetical protein